MRILSNNLLKITIIFLLLVFTNCFKDDEVSVQQVQLQEQKVHGVMEDASNYPHILNYLRQKTNGSFQYNISDNRIIPSSAQMRTANFGTVNTTKTVVVNDDEKSKYSFKMEDPNNLNDFVNLIVIEKEGTLQDFFIKYAPTQEWSEQQGKTPDMSTFTGNMMIFDFSGELISDLEFTDGTSSGENTNPFPCPEDTGDENTDDTEEDNSGDGSSGGAGDADYGDGTTDEGDYDGNPHGEGTGGGGGGGCIVQVVFVQCSCASQSDNPQNCNSGVHSSEECGANPPTGSYYTINMSAGCRTAPVATDNSTGEEEPDPCDPGEVGVVNGHDCVPDFNCRSGEFLDHNCECQINLSDPCANRDLINYEVSAEVKSVLESRQQLNSMVQSTEMVDSFILETIDDGWGDVNQDRFSIKINQLPNGYSPFQLFDEIRMNFSNLVVGGDIPYITDVNLEPYSDEDGTLWNSDNPVGAAMDFDTMFDTSTVYCVEYNMEEMYWIFATVTSYDHQGHFVAGVRQFGLEPNGSGGYSFYVRAADRLGGVLDYVANGLSGDEEALFTLAGDKTWKNLMENTVGFIQNNGGDVEEFDSNKTYGARHPYAEDGCPDEN